ncbi:MAG: hypothetical protein ACYTHM_12245 [Planctomycetota bacterium]|jgi:hypothetical protein
MRFFTVGLCLFALLGVALSSGVAWAQQKPDPERARVLEKVKTLLAENDSFTAIEFVNGLGDPWTVVQRHFALILDLYYKEKNLGAIITMGRAGIQYALTKSQELAKTDGEIAKKFRSAAQKMSFNLASFTWPGWDEKGITISKAQMAFGLDMARLDLRLVRELKLDAIKESTALWVLGAQHLALRDLSSAKQAFENARAKAREGKNAESEWMCHGYIAVTDILAKTAETEGRKAFDQALAELEKLGTEDAKFYRKQLQDVLKVFAH